jgi:PPP family 3-phenylpropionic acid transporter
VLLASLLLAALRWWLIGNWSQSLWLLVAAQSLHAFSLGPFHAAGVETIRRLFGRGAERGGQALFGAVRFGLGGAIGSWLAGRFWHLGAPLVFDVAALACVVAALIAWYGFRDRRLRD